MKKFFILIVVAFSFTSCIKSLLESMKEEPSDLFLPKHYFSFSPEKSVYNVGDTIQIKIVIPKKYRYYEGGPLYDITGITESFYDKMTFKLRKNKENNVKFLLDDISVEEGELNFVFDNNRQEYLLKEKVSIVFLKEGEFEWNSFFESYSMASFMTKNNVENIIFLKLNEEDKTFKVVS